MSFFSKLKNFFIKETKTVTSKEILQPQSSSKSYLEYDWTPVIEFETGGRTYYEKFLKRLTWPKGQSGITMGIGADLGYMSQEEFQKFFSKYFTMEENKLIKNVIGLKGEKAKAALPEVRQIQLSWENASEAFVSWTLPKFWKMTKELWPGLEQLSEKAQVALVSVVFNRGSSIAGSTRTEMNNIKPLVLNKDYKGIAEQIRSMKRLWVGKNMDGLLARREKEATMIEEKNS